MLTIFARVLHAWLERRLDRMEDRVLALTTILVGLGILAGHANTDTLHRLAVELRDLAGLHEFLLTRPEEKRHA